MQGIFSLRNLMLAILGACYLAVSYIATTLPHPPVVTVLIGLVPLAAGALAAAWKSRMRFVLLALYAACAVLGVRYLDLLRDHAAWLYFIQHAGAMTLLGLTFGSTLNRRPAEALCSRIALLIISEPLDEAYLRYTWKVTLAWTGYFFASAALSITLFFFGPIVVWSAFANLATPLLIGLMFVGEYLIRLRVLPDGPQISIAAIVRAYRQSPHRTDTPRS